MNWLQEAFLHISKQCWQIERKQDAIIDALGIENLNELKIEKAKTNLHEHVASLKEVLQQVSTPPEQNPKT